MQRLAALLAASECERVQVWRHSILLVRSPRRDILGRFMVRNRQPRPATPARRRNPGRRHKSGVRACACVCLRACACSCAHAHAHTNMHTHGVRVCVHVRACACAFVRVRARSCAFVRVRARVRVHMYTYARAHVCICFVTPTSAITRHVCTPLHVWKTSRQLLLRETSLFRQRFLKG